MATFIALYMTVNCAKFEKMWILHHFQGNYLKHATASLVKSNRNWFQTSDIVSPDWIRYFIFLQERHVPQYQIQTMAWQHSLAFSYSWLAILTISLTHNHLAIRASSLILHIDARTTSGYLWIQKKPSYPGTWIVWVSSQIIHIFIYLFTTTATPKKEDYKSVWSKKKRKKERKKNQPQSIKTSNWLISR